MEKLMALINLMRKGSSLADPALWKARQVNATMLGVLIIAIARALAAFGVDLHVDEDTATTIAGGIIAGVNVLLTYATSDKIGILPESRELFPEAMPASGATQPVPSGESVPLYSQADIDRAKKALADDRSR